MGLAMTLGASAGDKSAMSTEHSQSVETLRAALPSTLGFEVENVRTGNDGSACITYHVANNNGGESRVRAVVKGDKVERETTGNRSFEKAWNKQCAGAG